MNLIVRRYKEIFVTRLFQADFVFFASYLQSSCVAAVVVRVQGYTVTYTRVRNGLYVSSKTIQLKKYRLKCRMLSNHVELEPISNSITYLYRFNVFAHRRGE